MKTMAFRWNEFVHDNNRRKGRGEKINHRNGDGRQTVAYVEIPHTRPSFEICGAP